MRVIVDRRPAVYPVRIRVLKVTAVVQQRPKSSSGQAPPKWSVSTIEAVAAPKVVEAKSQSPTGTVSPVVSETTIAPVVPEPTVTPVIAPVVITPVVSKSIPKALVTIVARVRRTIVIRSHVPLAVAKLDLITIVLTIVEAGIVIARIVIELSRRLIQVDVVVVIDIRIGVCVHIRICVQIGPRSLIAPQNVVVSRVAQSP